MTPGEVKQLKSRIARLKERGLLETYTAALVIAIVEQKRSTPDADEALHAALGLFVPWDRIEG